MAQELQKLIRDAAETALMNFRNDYSGRAMFGRRCIGVVGNQREVVSLIVDVIKLAHIHGDITTVLEPLSKFSQDSMGRDLIIYWEELDPIEE